jgi:cytochrome c peroxidase
MAGNPKENEIAGAIHDRIDAAWPILAKRVRIIPAYGEMFVEAFDHIDTPEQVGIAEIANALADFINLEWRSGDSPYDRWLAGDPGALSPLAAEGAELFFGAAGCAACHNGPLLTDHGFHAIGLPAFGPGRTRAFDPMPRDVGRMGESDRLEDAYRFRTPSLRNVALTAPYGHNGAFATLEGIVRHHLDPAGSRAAWRGAEAALPDAPWLIATDHAIRADRSEMARQAAVLDIAPVSLEEGQIAALLAFLEALTGDTALNRPLGRPDTVPSWLTVDRLLGE